MSDKQDNFTVVTKKNNDTQPDQSTRYKLDKGWEVADLYLQMKDYTNKNSVDLLDQCSAHDLLDLVFEHDDSDDFFE